MYRIYTHLFKIWSSVLQFENQDVRLASINMIMARWIPLCCPTCGANLQVGGDKNQFSCDHCGTAYLLEHTLGDLLATEREHLSPLTTYTHQLQQWLNVGDYKVFVHHILEESINSERIVYVNVHYHNNSTTSLSCRRNQWVLYDIDAYPYDAITKSSLFTDRHPLGGERFISPNMQVRGWIAFKISQDTVIERLQFLTGFLSTKTAEFFIRDSTS